MILKGIMYFYCKNLGKNLIFMIIILINSISTVVLSDCPLLNSFINDTGLLILDKTTMINTESFIHCQWLVVGSSTQVTEY